VVNHGEVVRPAELPALVARLDGERAGLLTYRVDDRGLEVVTLDSIREGQGVGRALLDAALAEARRLGCHRLWLVTTNDNLRALGLYQRWGMRLAALRPGVYDEVRRTLKPQLPELGENGIPIRDELDLERILIDSPFADGTTEGKAVEGT
jgi:ribosomal protein S18 acetylase RimI-like enzyme